MTRKDYEALAAAFRTAYSHVEGTSTELTFQRHMGVTEALEKVADVLAGDNPRFIRDRFMAAAQQGVTS